ncbi:MAG TPA: hypothetical protein VK358_08710, partial [Longimicrobium sp.]|nr:hypothetical protein [Longimicrobium sp.]
GAASSPAALAHPVVVQRTPAPQGTGAVRGAPPLAVPRAALDARPGAPGVPSSVGSMTGPGTHAAPPSIQRAEDDADLPTLPTRSADDEGDEAEDDEAAEQAADQLAEQVYDRLVRRLAGERSRRGW